MGSKRNKSRRSRRVFHGNQYLKIPESLERSHSLGLSSHTEMEELHSASSKKIKLDHQFDKGSHKDFFSLCILAFCFSCWQLWGYAQIAIQIDLF